MSSYTPQTDLWIEQSRLIGMVLEGVSYGMFPVDIHKSKVDLGTAIGVFLLLTVQSLMALIQRPRHGGDIADHRLVLVFYIVITFIIGTVSTAADAKFTEMIWIDLRDALGGPLAVIENQMRYRINTVALSW